MKQLLQLLFLFSISIFHTQAQTITELHYDNASTDVGEFVEIYIPVDGCTYEVEFYNGSNGTIYGTTDAYTCTASNCTNGAPGCVFDIYYEGIQNGSPDGLALIQICGGVSTVIEFLSYEGTLTANNGTAMGMTSTDIGTQETSSTPIGHSIAINNGLGADPAPATPAICPDDVALAIDLLDFSATVKENQVSLDWSTRSESNNDYFMVEHSLDGRTFEAVEKIDGAGTTTMINDYTFEYQETKKGAHYYRIQQVDFNGTSSYSQIEEIFIENNNTISIHPTLVDQDITVNVGSELNTDAQINIFDATGQIVFEAIVSKHDTNKTLNIADLNTGTYFIIINADGQLHSTKFMKL